MFTAYLNICACLCSDKDLLKVYLVRHGAVDLNSPGMVYPQGCFYGGQVGEGMLLEFLDAVGLKYAASCRSFPVAVLPVL